MFKARRYNNLFRGLKAKSFSRFAIASLDVYHGQTSTAQYASLTFTAIVPQHWRIAGIAWVRNHNFGCRSQTLSWGRYYNSWSDCCDSTHIPDKPITCWMDLACSVMRNKFSYPPKWVVQCLVDVYWKGLTCSCWALLMWGKFKHDCSFSFQDNGLNVCELCKYTYIYVVLNSL